MSNLHSRARRYWRGLPLQFLFSLPLPLALLLLVAFAGAFSPDTVIRRALNPAFNAGDETAAFVVHGNGRLLYRLGEPPHALADLTHHPAVVSALGGGSGTSYLSLDDGDVTLDYPFSCGPSTSGSNASAPFFRTDGSPTTSC